MELLIDLTELNNLLKEIASDMQDMNKLLEESL